MITLPLRDRRLAAIPLSLLGALLIFIAVRGEPPSEPDTLPLSSSMTDGSGSSLGSAQAAWSGAAVPATDDVFDYTFVFPPHETPNQDTRVVQLDARAP